MYHSHVSMIYDTDTPKMYHWYSPTLLDAMHWLCGWLFLVPLPASATDYWL